MRGVKVHLPAVLVMLVAVAAVAGVTAFVAGNVAAARRLQPYVAADAHELRALEARYGGSRHSEHSEEWIVRDFFQDERGGVFVDVGANHYQQYSNTYYLETTLGWSGLAIEPQTRFAEDYARHRPRTRFVPLFVSDMSNATATLYVPDATHLIASGDPAYAGSRGGAVAPTPVTTTTLDDVLDRSGITRLDFLTMDIELGEPAALAGFTIERFRPRLVCIEAHAPIRQTLLDYFARHGYVLVGKYWRVDDDNFWFAPLQAP